MAESDRESFLRSERGREEWGCGRIPILSVPGRATVCRGHGRGGGLKGCGGGRDDR